MATSQQGMGSFMTDDYEDMKDKCMNDPLWAADEIERLREENKTYRTELERLDPAGWRR